MYCLSIKELLFFCCISISFASVLLVANSCSRTTGVERGQSHRSGWQQNGTSKHGEQAPP